MLEKLESNLKDTITNIKNDVKATELEIMINANYNLINLYYRIGKSISENCNWEIDLLIAYP